LEKVGKNLFRMFRDQTMDASRFVKKFTLLKEKLSASRIAVLDLEYYKELESYIERLYAQVNTPETFNDTVFNDIREAEMSNLNRLQKMKNSKSYKKSKHKQKDHNEWEE